MARSCRIGALLRPGFWVALLLLPAVLMAADRAKRKPLPKGEPVEIFSAIEQGQIEVQLIPRNPANANLLIKNKTDKPLRVALPEAFAGVPVLAQIQNDLIGNNRVANDAQLPQTLGVGPGRNNLWGRGVMNVGGPNVGRPNRPPGFFFNVAPEKVGKLKLTGVCLEYGKPDPRPKFKYQIKPIRSVTDKPGVAELCEMLGRGEISQRAAQLAAWHLNNDVSWEKLASTRQKLAIGSRPTYTRRELQAGKEAAEKATELAKQHPRPSAGEAESPNQG
jgi:hypothetical protein